MSDRDVIVMTMNQETCDAFIAAHEELEHGIA